MNRNGFTLIELLATIAIIALIALIITPTVTKLIEKNKIDSCSSIISSIESAASSYVSDHRYDSNVASGNSFSITLRKLKEDGYLTGSIKNPLVDNDTEDNHLNETVTVTYNTTSKTFSYRYNGSITCSS